MDENGNPRGIQQKGTPESAYDNITMDYSTGYERIANKELYWIEAGNEEADVRNWNRSNFGCTSAAELVTDANGMVTSSTVGLEPGTYYLAALGG